MFPWDDLTFASLCWPYICFLRLTWYFLPWADLIFTFLRCFVELTWDLIFSAQFFVGVHLIFVSWCWPETCFLVLTWYLLIWSDLRFYFRGLYLLSDLIFVFLFWPDISFLGLTWNLLSKADLRCAFFDCSDICFLILIFRRLTWYLLPRPDLRFAWLYIFFLGLKWYFFLGWPDICIHDWPDIFSFGLTWYLFSQADLIFALFFELIFTSFSWANICFFVLALYLFFVLTWDFLSWYEIFLLGLIYLLSSTALARKFVSQALPTIYSELGVFPNSFICIGFLTVLFYWCLHFCHWINLNFTFLKWSLHYFLVLTWELYS